MINLLRYFLVLIVVLTSCTSFYSENVIPETEFIDILVDVHLADGVLTVLGYKVVRDSIAIEQYYDDVFRKHNISRNTFEEALKYYSKNPEDYDKIYEKVQDQLTIMKGKLEETIKEEEKAKGEKQSDLKEKNRKEKNKD